MFVVDTNVLLYAADASSEFQAPCGELLKRAPPALAMVSHLGNLMREHGIGRIVTRDSAFFR